MHLCSDREEQEEEVWVWREEGRRSIGRGGSRGEDREEGAERSSVVKEGRAKLAGYAIL